MIGLMVILAMVIYLAISVGVVKWTIRWARKTGRSVRRWGIVAGFAMYLLVFWDHIPTLMLHKYYCATKAGFWVYKTPEQWKAENPGVAETLTWRERSPSFHNPDGTWGFKVNERFVWENRLQNLQVLPIKLHIESVLDVGTGETMVKRISVGSGYGSFPIGGEDWRVLKFWVRLEPCIPNIREFGQYQDAFKHLGREVK